MLAKYFPWILYALAWYFTILAVQQGREFWEALLFFVTIFNGGFQGLWAAIGHLAFTKKTAKQIGWSSNGFQIEIGFVNLALGITGILIIFNPSWSVPYGLILFIFWSGCAYNHFKEKFLKGNNAVFNSGPMLYCTTTTVATLLICLVALFAMQF
jgi:hypothetical protein